MIKSDVADVKNGGGCCGNSSRQGCLSAASVKEGPGFTWTSPERPGAVLPPMLMRSKGATGAGVTTLYYLMKEASLPH